MSVGTEREEAWKKDLDQGQLMAALAIVPSADPSPNPLLGIMTAMIDVKPTNDQLLNLPKGFTERVP